jgi:hypothetical protein
MVLVVLFGEAVYYVNFWVVPAVEERRASFALVAGEHAAWRPPARRIHRIGTLRGGANPGGPVCWSFPQPPTPEDLADVTRHAYYRDKYNFAARYPWLPVWPDNR